MKKSYWIGFSLLEISYWSFHASFLGFLTSYLLSKGISNTVVSMFLVTFLLASFVGSFVWGIVCDRFHTNRRVSILCFLADLFFLRKYFRACCFIFAAGVRVSAECNKHRFMAFADLRK